MTGTGGPSQAGELALVLGGGGARGAYQVGCLRGLARLFPELDVSIQTGVSAGAINTVYLGSHPGPFHRAVAGLERVWTGLTVEDVFRTDVAGVVGNALRWALRLSMGGARVAPRTRGLVDTTPLRRTLERALTDHGAGIGGIARNLERGRLRALALTSTNYTTGRTITWVQGRDLRHWERPFRRSVATELTLDHVLASSSLPLFFPAVQIGDQWHGDGGVRLTAPLSPALHLGADRILAISTRYRPETWPEPSTRAGYPPPAQVVGVLLNAIFLDALDADALHLERINRLLAERSPDTPPDGLRPVELCVLRPSVDLGRLAGQFEPVLRGPLRWLLRGTGSREAQSPDSLSMLMFQREYACRLIELGERDAEARADELRRFLDRGPRAESAAR